MKRSKRYSSKVRERVVRLVFEHEREYPSQWAAARRSSTADTSGFYATARCRYFWATVPFLPRDPRRPEDVILATAADHAADAALRDDARGLADREQLRLGG